LSAAFILESLVAVPWLLQIQFDPGRGHIMNYAVLGVFLTALFANILAIFTPQPSPELLR